MCMLVCICAAFYCMLVSEFPEKADVLHQCAVRVSQAGLEAIPDPLPALAPQRLELLSVAGALTATRDGE